MGDDIVGVGDDDDAARGGRDVRGALAWLGFRRHRAVRVATWVIGIVLCVLGLRPLVLLARQRLVGPAGWAADSGGSIRSHIIVEGGAWTGERRLVSVSAGEPREAPRPCHHTTAGALYAADDAGALLLLLHATGWLRRRA